MRVMIFEPAHQGHHLQYVRSIVDALQELSVTNILLVTCPGTPTSTEFAMHLGEIKSALILDTSIEVQQRSPLGMHASRFLALRDAIRKYKPDHVYVPYADGLMQMSGLANLFGIRWNRRKTVVEGLLMRGRFAYGLRGKLARFRDLASLLPLRFSPFDIIHQLDPLVFEFVKKRGESWSRRCRLLPEAVEQMEITDSTAARKRLGIATDGRYLGFFGRIDSRKGADLLLRSFVATSLRATDRLLLMGYIEPDIKAILDTECAALLKSGQIVVINKYVSQDMLHLGMNAVDAIAAPYPRHIGSSGIVVRAAALGKPVLGTTFGWVGEVVQKFGLGWTCNVENQNEFSAAINVALGSGQAYYPNIDAMEFTAFHAMENFKLHWTHLLSQRPGINKSFASVERQKQVLSIYDGEKSRKMDLADTWAA